MNEPNPEDDLQPLFDLQRDLDRPHASTFHAMRSRVLQAEIAISRSKPPLIWPWLLPAGAIAALGFVVWFAAPRSAVPLAPSRRALSQQLEELQTALQRNAASEHALTAWQSPTDFLLRPIHNDPL